MLRKFLGILISLVICFSGVSAFAAEEPTPFAADEAISGINEAISLSLSEEEVQQGVVDDDDAGEGLYAVSTGEFVFITDTDTLTDSSRVERVRITTPEYSDARGMTIGTFVSNIFQYYPMENWQLFGSKDEALIYLDTEAEGGVSYGIVYRDGQRIQSIQYSQLLKTDDGWCEAGVSYEIDSSFAVSITLYSSSDALTDSEKEARVGALRALRTQKEVFSYIPYDGAEVAMLSREDLIFDKTDLFSITPDEALASYGKAQETEYLSSSDGTFLYTMQWEDLTLAFMTDAQKNVLYPVQAYVIGDTVEGPRGIRVGDYLFDVLMRFPQGNGMRLDGIETLYASEAGADIAPYGKVVYYDNEQTVYYACDMDFDDRNDNVCVLILSFIDNKLVNYTVDCRFSGQNG
ncbi:MAG: hypothetical protein PHI27_13135 [Eubacteriales bacterium]|nr:hypothetical protein [Eubacteriales bacterium]MDD3883167.1 hypothetical protein [Eubacteriales bacterium]MDD4512450.1 hypothetical protein [Eubacteriales bacterium]